MKVAACEKALRQHCRAQQTLQHLKASWAGAVHVNLYITVLENTEKGMAGYRNQGLTQDTAVCVNTQPESSSPIIIACRNPLHGAAAPATFPIA